MSDNKKERKIIDDLRQLLSGRKPIEVIPNHSKSRKRYAVLAIETATGQLYAAMETFNNIYDQIECEKISKLIKDDYGDKADVFIMRYHQAVCALTADNELKRKVANVTDSESAKAIIN